MVKSSEYIIAEMEFEITTTEKHKLVLKLCFAQLHTFDLYFRNFD